MSKNNHFARLRAKLDDAITYGSKKEALQLAREGIRCSRHKGWKAEEEYFLGQLALLREDFPLAITHFDRAIALNPRDGAAYNDRALCMIEMGIIDGAIPYFNKGIKAEPDYPNVWHNKGWLLNNIGRHTEAIECLKKALKIEPDRAVTYDNLGDAYYNLGKFKHSLEAYAKVLELLKPGCCPGIRKQIAKRVQELKAEMEKENS